MDHKIVDKDEWIKARSEFLLEERKFTKLRDELSAKRRDLPWFKVTEKYEFDSSSGKIKFPELFGTGNQLIVYHLMFAPNWENACSHCSFWADNFDGLNIHMNQKGVNLVAVSRANYAKLARYKDRMNWSFPWYSSENTSFNFEFYASFTEEEVLNKRAFFNYKYQDPYVSDREGISVFFKNEKNEIFHTYSTFARGIDLQNTVYNYFDLCPLGRNETPGNPMDWVKRKDEY